ncbi:hypothetical protein AB1Y20_020865 [Prymnesium parvum]|uniref:Uncharacterized protein n=1 Tax=Prymnesium parvum TaxID=97485 RepID=A0AB34K0M0_PRYPA
MARAELAVRGRRLRHAQHPHRRGQRLREKLRRRGDEGSRSPPAAACTARSRASLSCTGADPLERLLLHVLRAMMERWRI